MELICNYCGHEQRKPIDRCEICGTPLEGNSHTRADEQEQAALGMAYHEAFFGKDAPFPIDRLFVAEPKEGEQ
jgi:hypothetical protein